MVIYSNNINNVLAQLMFNGDKLEVMYDGKIISTERNKNVWNEISLEQWTINAYLECIVAEYKNKESDLEFKELAQRMFDEE